MVRDRRRYRSGARADIRIRRVTASPCAANALTLRGERFRVNGPIGLGGRVGKNANEVDDAPVPAIALATATSSSKSGHAVCKLGGQTDGCGSQGDIIRSSARRRLGCYSRLRRGAPPRLGVSYRLPDRGGCSIATFHDGRVARELLVDIDDDVRRLVYAAMQTDANHLPGMLRLKSRVNWFCCPKNSASTTVFGSGNAEL